MGIIIAFWLSGWGVAPLGPAESTTPFDQSLIEAAGGSTSLAALDQASMLGAGGSTSLATFDRAGSL